MICTTTSPDDHIITYEFRPLLCLPYRSKETIEQLTDPVGWPGDHRVTESRVIVGHGLTRSLAREAPRREEILLRCVDCGETCLTVFDFTPRCRHKAALSRT